MYKRESAKHLHGKQHEGFSRSRRDDVGHKAHSQQRRGSGRRWTSLASPRRSSEKDSDAAAGSLVGKV